MISAMCRERRRGKNCHLIRTCYGIRAFFFKPICPAAEAPAAAAATAEAAEASDYNVQFYVPCLRSNQDRSEASASSGVAISVTPKPRETTVTSFSLQATQFIFIRTSFP